MDKKIASQLQHGAFVRGVVVGVPEVRSINGKGGAFQVVNYMILSAGTISRISERIEGSVAPVLPVDGAQVMVQLKPNWRTNGVVVVDGEVYDLTEGVKK